MLPRVDRRALAGALLRVALVSGDIALTTSVPRAAVTGGPVQAASDSAPLRSVAGEVRERVTRAPIAGAIVVLQARSGATLAVATTSDGGRFVFPAANDPNFRIRVRATGYEDASLSLGRAVLRVPLLVLLAPQSGLRRIGATAARAAAGGEAARSATIGPQSLAAGRDMRVADAFAALPGLTVSGDALAPGGDAYVSQRGLRPGETQTLLDGHPIGPIGVAAAAPDADGTVAGFNYQNAPYFALRSVDVTSGAAHSDLFGTGGVAGTIDLRTFEPTRRTELFAAQSVGTEGRTSTALRATGTIGSFGYAFAHGVTGTYGLFDNVAVAQTGLRGNDFTSATLRGLTYDVSGAYVLRNELAKIDYAIDAHTSLAFAAYDATSWSDKTGEGDNDFIPYAYALANAPVGERTTCPHGVTVVTDAGSKCLSPSTYALGAAGPAGGGPGAWQALRDQDYDLRLRRSSAQSTITFETFSDRYALLYHRDPSLAGGRLDAFLDRWSTLGLRLAAENVASKNDVSYGATILRERLNADGTIPDGARFATSTPSIRNDRAVFVHDTFSPTPHLSLSLGGSLATSDGDPALRFDPRGSVTYRPSSHDAFSMSVGRSSEEPSLETGRVDLLPTGALNPDCGALAHATQAARANVAVGSGPAANLAAESALDSEFAYARAFGRDTSARITLYDTSLRNRIVTADLPAGTQVPQTSRSALLARIDRFCGFSPPPDVIDFTLSRAFNAATARARGIELGGRALLAPHVALEYAYDVQSIVVNDLPNAVLATDPTLVNGAQAFEVPLQKATLGVEYTTPGGLDVRLDGHAIAANNPQQLTGFAYADASLAQAVSKRLSFSVTVANVFDSHAQTYGLVGLGIPYTTNAYGVALTAPFVQPFNERYGLQPASVSVSAALHV